MTSLYYPTYEFFEGATAQSGDRAISLKESVDWPVGSQIVIATTGNKFSTGESEMATIVTSGSNGTYLELDRPLKFQHLSVKRMVGDVGLPVEAEVGLLTKNIVFRGSVDKSWAKFGSDEFGAIITVR